MAKKTPPEVLPEGRPVWGRNAAGQPICNKDISSYRCLSCGKTGRGRKDACPACGLKVEITEKYCGQVVLMENGRCRIGGHGGKSTGRPIVHGGRSELYQKLGIHASAERVRKDSVIRTHQENIVLFEAMMAAEAEGLGTDPDIWDRARKLLAEVSKGSQGSIEQLGALLKQGYEAAETRKRVLDLADRQRRHIEAENRREARLEQSISARQMDNVLTVLLELVLVELRDNASRRRVAEGFARFMCESDPAGALN